MGDDPRVQRLLRALGDSNATPGQAPPTQRLVALRIPLAGEYAEPLDRARFQREAQAVASLRHSNVVQVYDVGEGEGRPYLTIELVEGEAECGLPTGSPLRGDNHVHSTGQAARQIEVDLGGGRRAPTAGVPVDVRRP
jgi:hypothetical protein